mmetsp:Transcript_5105/g.16397  ORF Transcript_5105/g.16397 Transcript_5105/m.16397 type:complete len:200 (+) Transcript_5105:740-1339(+)
MSEPKTSEPLHSSCTRTTSGRDVSGMDASSPKMRTVQPPIGGRKISRSARVTSSGNMPPVCSNSLRRSASSSSLKRRATPGRCQTGSMEALMQETTPPSRRIVPSAESRPSRSASTISGMRASKREMAMEGCTLTPRARAAAESAESGADTIAPHGSSATMASALYHEGYGPMVTTGSVLCRSRGRDGSMICFAMPTAR